MNVAPLLAELRSLANESYKKVLLNHGVPEPCLGVKIADLKTIQKRTKTDHALALALHETGIYDAMYLAGLIADDAAMTKEDLRRWAKKACGPLAGSTVPWVAAGSRFGWEMALEWIESDKELVACAGWGTLSSLVAIKDDASLDLTALKKLLTRVKQTIHRAPNAVRYQMNGFVIAVGSSVRGLTDFAKEIATEIGPVNVDVGNTACQVPFAPDYIRKVEARGTIGKKRKSAKC